MKRHVAKTYRLSPWHDYDDKTGGDMLTLATEITAYNKSLDGFRHVFIFCMYLIDTR